MAYSCCYMLFINILKGIKMIYLLVGIISLVLVLIIGSKIKGKVNIGLTQETNISVEDVIRELDVNRSPKTVQLSVDPNLFKSHELCKEGDSGEFYIAGYIIYCI